MQKSRAFCGARSSLHLRTDPLYSLSLDASRSDPLARAAGLYADAPAGTDAPVIIAARDVHESLGLFNENNALPGVKILM